MSPRITITEIKVIDLLFPILGLLVTIARLGIRLRSARFWWDDTLACASAIFMAIMGAVTWIHYMDPDAFSRVTRIAAYYLIAECFYVALWAARLSILFSILRIVPESGTRKFLNRASLGFACICVFLCAQVFWVCENQPRWKAKPQPQCALGLQVAVCQLVTDIASDLLLIAVPVRLFSRSNLGRGLKIRLVVIFSAAALTTVVSLVHAAYILEGLGEQAIISAIAEISVSLIVCNFVVVVPAFWRSCGVHDDSGARERTFKLSSVRFATAPNGIRSSIVDTDTTLSVHDRPAVMDVTGIVHDSASRPSIEPPVRRSIRFERGDPEECPALEASTKGFREHEDHIEEPSLMSHDRKKNEP